jgi:hypothetical protein
MRAALLYQSTYPAERPITRSSLGVGCYHFSVAINGVVASCPAANSNVGPKPLGSASAALASRVPGVTAAGDAVAADSATC